MGNNLIEEKKKHRKSGDDLSLRGFFVSLENKYMPPSVHLRFDDSSKENIKKMIDNDIHSYFSTRVSLGHLNPEISRELIDYFTEVLGVE